MNKLKRSIVASICLSASLTATRTFAREAPADPEGILAQAAAQSQFAFLLFYKQNDPATAAMQKTLEAGVAKRSRQAAFAKFSVTDPAAQTLVERFGVARAPLPLTVAVAPNGALTGVYSRKLTDAHLSDAIVTPTMAACMKAMQAGKLAIVCVQAKSNRATPQAVEDLLADPEFANRIHIESFPTSDSAEARFLSEMEVAPESVKDATIVLLAPPGVLVGKFANTATKSELVAALHEAGKCCDDPNCKHAKGNSTAPTDKQPPRSANHAPNAKRK